MANNIDYIHPNLSNNLKYYEFIDNINNGWIGIVDNGSKYLVKSKNETPDKFANRLELASFKDYFNPTIDNIVGLVFKNGIKLNEDVPLQLQEDLKNADNEGNNFERVFTDYFDNAMRKGIDYILVDKSSILPQSRAEEINTNARPYLVGIKAENVTSWKTTTVNGYKKLSQVKIREFVEENVDGNMFETELVEQYLVYALDDNGKSYYQRYDEDGLEINEVTYTGLDFIPLFDLNIDQEGYFTAKPPFYEMGKLNINIYNNDSDCMWASHTANIPFYYASGYSKEELEDIKISPNTMIRSDQADAKINIVDYDGKGIANTQIINDSIEKRIYNIGFSVVMEDKTQTATESIIANSQRQSKLSRWIGLLKLSIERILDAMAIMGGYGATGGTIEIDANILKTPLDAQQYTALMNSLTNGNISYDLAWQFVEAGEFTLPEDFDKDTEAQLRETSGLLSGNQDE